LVVVEQVAQHQQTVLLVLVQLSIQLLQQAAQDHTAD
jgi:hypothetical protein